MTLQNRLQFLQIHGFLVEESLDPGEVFQTPELYGIRNNMLRGQDSCLGGSVFPRLELHFGGVLERLLVKS